MCDLNDPREGLWNFKKLSPKFFDFYEKIVNLQKNFTTVSSTKDLATIKVKLADECEAS